MFVPSGVPIFLLPFLVIIEIVSHIAKIFSLAIRLFANMMSGHVLLHILTGFVFNLGKINFIFSLIPLLLILIIFSLEYGITFLQAYVFVTLLAIYFEEHFGFTKEETSKVSKIIMINGQKNEVVTCNYSFSLFFFYLITTYTGKEFFFFGIDSYARKRSYFKRKNFWKLSVLSDLIFTYKTKW